nr:efflux RND transporter periplasmic adaptor subunit [Feifania hominis]
MSAGANVHVVTPSVATVYRSVNCRGQIEAGNTRDIFVSGGTVEKVHVEIGDKVKKGDLLITFEQTVSRYDAAPAANDSSAAIEDLLGENADALSGLLGQYGSDIQSVINQLAPALGGSSSSPQTYDGAEMTQNITAPFSGTITALNAKAGDRVTSSRAVVSIADLTDLYVKAQVSESYISEIETGQRVKITGEGFRDITYEGTVSKIYPTATKSSLSTQSEMVVPVEIKIKNADEALKPGFSVSAEIRTVRKENSILLPYEALRQDEENREYVYVAVYGRAYKRYVTSGIELADEVSIDAGILPEYRIIVGEDRELEDRARVNILASDQSEQTAGE